jgi:hypothetical protein
MSRQAQTQARDDQPEYITSRSDNNSPNIAETKNNLTAATKTSGVTTAGTMSNRPVSSKYTDQPTSPET